MFSRFSSGIKVPLRSINIFPVGQQVKNFASQKYKLSHKLKKFNKVSKPYGLLPLTNNEGNVTVLRALDHCRLKDKHLLMCKTTIHKRMKRTGVLYSNLQADIPISKKPLEIRMGKGKGGVDHMACRVLPGTILYEIHGLKSIFATRIFQRIQKKLPLPTQIITY
jgi:large subunit ribosomal protein L16